MTGPISTPRFSAQDFETASIRSTAPSYVSDVPSYHSTVAYLDATPAYSTVVATASQQSRSLLPPSRRPTIGLPPVPPAPIQSIPSLSSFRIPTWSNANAPAARHYRKVAERRVVDGRNRALDQSLRRNGSNSQVNVLDRQNESNEIISRPLEDPYLVGEEAAAEARRDRLAREVGDDVLMKEDRQWDWLLAHMKDRDERERSWSRYRQNVDQNQRKKILRRLGGRLF